VGRGLGMRRIGDTLSQVADQSVDCVVASPGSGDLGSMDGVFAQLRRVLVDSGVVWLDLADDRGCGGPVGTAWRTAFVLQREGWILRNAVIWHDRRQLGGYGTLLLLVKQQSYWFDLDPIREPKRTRRLASGRGKNPGDVWSVASTDGAGGLSVEVAMRCVAAGCPPAGVVLDPFCAGVSVEVAARRLGRRFVGVSGVREEGVRDAA
jgi:hypothetical protein